MQITYEYQIYMRSSCGCKKKIAKQLCIALRCETDRYSSTSIFIPPPSHFLYTLLKAAFTYSCCSLPVPTSDAAWRGLQLWYILDTKSSYCMHTMKMSPECLPSMRSLQQVPSDHPLQSFSFSHSPVSFNHLFIIVSCSSIYHLALLSVEIVYLSLVSQHHRGCVSCPFGIAPHSTHLAADPRDSKATKTPTEPWQVQGTGFIQIVK